MIEITDDEIKNLSMDDLRYLRCRFLFQQNARDSKYTVWNLHLSLYDQYLEAQSQNNIDAMEFLKNQYGIDGFYIIPLINRLSEISDNYIKNNPNEINYRGSEATNLIVINSIKLIQNKDIVTLKALFANHIDFSEEMKQAACKSGDDEIIDFFLMKEDIEEHYEMSLLSYDELEELGLL